MKVAETSLEAYYGKEDKGTLTGDRAQVYQIIKENKPISGSMIARKMQKPYHAITGRITELRNADKIEIAGFTTNKYGNQVRTYQVKQ